SQANGGLRRPFREGGMGARRQGNALRGGGDVRGPGAPRALQELQLDLLAFRQGLVAVHRDRRVVDEDVVAALTCDEAESLFVREPLHGARLYLRQRRPS